MYGYNNHHYMEENTSSSNYMYNHFITSSQTLPLVSNLPPPPLSIPTVNNNTTHEFDSLKSEFCNYNNSSSSCSSYGSPSPATSYNNDPTSLIQRSISSHSLLIKNMEGFCPIVSSPTGFIDLETSSVRKALSTSDLQAMHLMQYNKYRSESPNLSSESNSIIEGMNKASKYSPQEKKERIERYRSKRNQRNFNKKIKYECRKTLADSRPRIRGRFARNDEILERNPQNEYWNQSRLEELDDENWIGFLDAFVP